LLFFASAPGNLVEYSATFPGSPSYQDVFIPLTNPTLTGTGPWPSLTDEPEILLDIGLDTPGGTWSIDGVTAVTTPEPSTLLLLGICLLGLVARSRWRRSPR
jgi:PEP-CTERM motif